MGTTESIIGMIPPVIATDIFVRTAKKTGLYKKQYKKRKRKMKRKR